MSEVERASQFEGLAQEDAIRDLIRHVHNLDPLNANLVKLAIKNAMLSGAHYMMF